MTPPHCRTPPPATTAGQRSSKTRQRRGGGSTSSLFNKRLPWGRQWLRPSEQATATRSPGQIWELDPTTTTTGNNKAGLKLKLQIYSRSVTSAISGKPWPPARLGIYPAGKGLDYCSRELAGLGVD
jgi:hypothetical protein